MRTWFVPTVPTSSASRVTSSNPRATSLNPRVTISNPRAAKFKFTSRCSNLRVTSSHPRFQELFNQ